MMSYLRRCTVLVLLLACVAGATGVLSIAGYTTIDQQIYGPSLKRIAFVPGYGTHLIWRDAGLRGVYSFFDVRTGNWHWPGGTTVFDRPVGLGNLAVNPLDSLPTISGSFLARGMHHAIFAYDSAIGSGRFTCIPDDDPYELEWSLNAFSNSGHHQFAALRHDTIVNHRGGGPTNLGKIGQFPSHNISGSLVNSQLAIFWTRNEAPNIGDLYLRRSTNGGTTWRDTIVPSHAIPSMSHNTFLGAYGDYDTRGELHIVVNTWDGTDAYQSELWHYCEADTPNWSRIISCAASPRSGVLPDQTLIADRPSIGQDAATGDLFAVWEQFDATNVELATGILRSDIWAARSQDWGRTWGRPLRLTELDNTSKCYPNLATVVNETLHVAFLIDSVAGNSAQGQGRETNNPIAYLRFPTDKIPSGIAENQPPLPVFDMRPEAAPNPFGDKVEIRLGPANPEGFTTGNTKDAKGIRTGLAGIKVYDRVGQLVRVITIPQSSSRISQSLSWDGLDQTGKPVPAGIYFAMLSGFPSRDQSASLMITRVH